ncbi:MAG: O-antigen ligase family protein, partial [Legionella sp.]|nr:O-antigen ligase family protein [Legionella sp.]
LFFLVVLSLIYYDLFSLFFDVIIIRFENSESIYSFLASSRDVFVVNALSNFHIEGLYFLRLFFGFGVYMSFRTVSDDISLYDTLENDFFDIFFSYGFIGICVFISFYLFHAFRAISSKKFEALLIFSTLFLISALIGHVLFDAMAVIPFVLSAALTNIKLRKPREKNCLYSFVK